MKHLKLLNILIVMLLLTAWIPAPAPLAALAAPTLSAPASGALVDGYRPQFAWAQPAYDPDTYNLLISFDSTFKNAARQIAAISVDDVLDNGLIRYTPDFDLPSNSLIYWRVQAVDGGVNSAWAGRRSLKTKPHPVAGVTGPTGGANSLTLRPTLTWLTTDDTFGDVLRTNKFNIQVIKTGGAVVKTATVTGSSYVFTTDLLRDTQYSWRVRADGAYADSDWTGYHDFVTPNPPSVPVLVSPANGFVVEPGGQPILDWKDSTTTSGLDFSYIVEISTSAKFDTLFVAPIPVDASQYTVTEVLNTGTYYWRVKSVDSTGAASNYSLVRSFKTWPSLTIEVRDYLTKELIPATSLIISGVPGTVEATDGTYVIPSLKAGAKTVTATKADYVTKKASVSVVNGVARVLVIEMVHVPMYVKLYWTNAYQNLDLHLWVPEEYTFGADDEGGHIMADHKGSTTKAPYARLTADVLKGSARAVETITIQNRYPGVYTIGVYSFNKSSLFGTGAKVRIYMGTVLMQELLVPATESDTRIWWHVADLSTGGVLDPLNQMVPDSPGPYDPDGGTFAVPAQ